MGLARFLGMVLVLAALTVAAQGQSSVTLAWNPAAGTNIAGYKLYCGVASRTYTTTNNVGNVTNATVSSLTSGTIYYFAATAVDTSGSESGYSTEVVYTIPVATAPTIVLSSPVSGASYTAPATISCAASVTANGHTITQVQFYNGATLLGTVASAPYSYSWNSVGAGTYSLSAKAVYDSGSTVASTPANVTVTNVPLPSIALTAPLNGASYAAPATINTAANVTANGHTITQVQFYNGATLLGTVAAAPYSFSWANVSAGTYSLSAKAVYDSGSTVASTPANVTVTNMPLPAIVLTAPANGASYAAPASISLAATVTANGHTITKVQFYNGATLIGQDATAPYNLTWTNVSAGSYSLSASMVYEAGSTLASSPVSVVVTGLPAPWQTADIGSVAVAGSASMSNGLYTVQGAGNISGTADSFRFVYQPLSGDGEIRVRLNSLGNTGTSGRIGVMIRESLTSGSRYAWMGISPDGTFRWQRRDNTGGSTSSRTSTIGTPPNAWTRLVRTGNALYAYNSTNGTNWTQVSSRSITMATNIYVGLAVASGSSNTLNRATFTNVTVVP